MGICWSFNKSLFVVSQQQFVHKKDHYLSLEALFV